MGTQVLLTGGSGMVGRNILEHPLAQMWEIVAPGRTELDLRDAGAVEQYLRKLKPAAIIHAAGRVGGIQANIAYPVEFLVENVDIGRNVILGARAAGVRKLLNLASSCIYPRDRTSPLREDEILSGRLEPTNEGYAIAKLYALKLCQYIQRDNLKFIYKTLIPCNLYGRHDKFSPEHSHLAPAIIHKVHQAKRQGLDTVEIWGDGQARREFMYAGDLADAVLRALSDIETLPDLMNVGVGSDHSISEYYKAVADVIGWTGTFVYDLQKPVGMARKLIDIGRQQQWGWLPSTSLSQGLQMTYSFYLGLHE